MKAKRIAGTITVVMLLAILFCAMITPVAAYSYNRQAAVDYAKANADNNVPGSWLYQFHGGDCTNFVSQSLHLAGGWPEIRAQWAPPQYQWYFDGVFNSQHSNSWTVVGEFGDFITTSGRGTKVSFSHNDVWARPTQFTTGDILQLDKTGDGSWDHTMIITGITGNDVLITQHTDNKKDHPVSEIISKYPNSKFRVFLLKNTFTY